MMNRKRLSALLLCIGMILALFVSSAYIAYEAGHDCCGEDCSVCQMIELNSDVLRLIGLAVLAWLTLSAFMRAGYAGRMQLRPILPVSGTLVSWKIRLDD